LINSNDDTPRSSLAERTRKHLQWECGYPVFDGPAQYLGLSLPTLETLRSRGGGPVFTKLGRRVVYQKEDLDAWLSERRKSSTSQE